MKSFASGFFAERVAHDIERVAQHRLDTGTLRTRRWNCDQILTGDRPLQLRILNRRRRSRDLELLVVRRVLDDDVEHEAVELRFRQRIGAFELDRVLRREHVERFVQLVGLALHRDAVLLHRFEQRRLRLRRGAVDFVRQHDVGEDRPGARPSAAPVASSCTRSVPVMSDGKVRVNWMRENLRSSTRAIV